MDSIINSYPIVPKGRDDLIATFGDLSAPQFEVESIVVFDLPHPMIYPGLSTGAVVVKKSRCHRLMLPVFLAVLNDLQQYADLLKEDRDYISYGGIYVRRPIRGQPLHPSTHSWGVSIDIEPVQFPLGSQKQMPQPVVALFEQYGFVDGGKFKSRRDPQHFQYCLNY
jgi:hypothetical protein